MFNFKYNERKGKMKKVKILSVALALTIVAAVIIACTKEKETKVAQKSNEMVTVSKEDDMSAYLKQFKEKMQSTSKGDETLSMEDARWHLEAVLNYTYGDAGHLFSDIQCDTFYYKLPTQNKEITLAQLNEAFNVFSESVEETYTDCSLPEKSILAIQTKFESESRDGDVSVRSILSIGGSSNTINMCFDSTDYWDEWYYDNGDGYIEAGGKCGLYEGDCPDSGAPLELTRKLNLRMPLCNCHYGGGYYTDEETVILSYYSDYQYYPFDNYVYDENSPCRYKLYYRNEDPHEPWASNPGGCICPEDMNYYLSKGPELVDHYKPIGKVFISGYYQSLNFVGLGLREDNCYHELILNYGKLNCNNAGNDN